MFTWICPKCGTEVPPAYNECPNCAPKDPARTGAGAGAPPQPAAPVKPVEPAAPHPEQPTQPVQTAQPLPSYGPPAERKAGLPSWLVMVIAMATLGAALAVLYIFVLPATRKPEPATAAKLETPAPAARSTNPLARHLEVAGVRITEAGAGRIKVQFLVINHSAADLPDLKANVTLRNSKGEVVFEFPQDVPSIGPYESRDLTAQIKSPLRAYELPDWQLMRGELEITSQE